MPNLPHNFERFLSANVPPVLVVGAGLSFGLVPLPGQLLEEKKDAADKVLRDDYGIEPIEIDLTDGMALYIWAEAVIEALAAVAPGDEKRIIAKILGLTTEGCWSAKVDIDLRGSTPRHRVIARFAREQMWRSIWSINWDTILESALEQVGFNHNDGLVDQGWPTAFATNLLSTDFAANSPNNVVDICKPHGCVNGLAIAEEKFTSGETQAAREICDRLMIGKTELEIVRNNEHDNAFFNRFRDHILTGPLISAGWSASEPSLRKVIKESVKPKGGIAEELTIIDPVCNDDGHAEMLNAYGLNVRQVHCEVSTSNTELTTDRLFLWLQVRFTLLNIEKQACGEWKGIISDTLKSTHGGVLPKLLVQFADDFLPAWVRLCWRSGIIELPPGVNPESFDLEKQDHHIPLRGAETTRADLKSAASILFMLRGHEAKWDLNRFPGCLWCNDTQRLVVPIPAWAETEQVNDLRALKVLFKRLQFEAGHISAASIIPIKRSPDDQVDQKWGVCYKLKVSQFFRVPMLADPNNWSILDNLSGDCEGLV